MRKFSKEDIPELKDYLYHSYIHDAKLKRFHYRWRESRLELTAVNSIFHEKEDFAFLGVEAVCIREGHELGRNDTILGLSVQEDLAQLRDYIRAPLENEAECLHLIFELFSGTELHIAARETAVEITRSRRPASVRWRRKRRKA